MNIQHGISNRRSKRKPLILEIPCSLLDIQKEFGQKMPIALK